jgi:nitrogen fixation-related uncharacterized protein
MRNNKLTLPISILMGCIILGGFFYKIQIEKQASIERQQERQLQDDRLQKNINNALEELKLKQKECESLSAGVIKKWNNVMGVTYDNDVWKACVVTYTDTKTGEVETSPLEFMQNSK